MFYFSRKTPVWQQRTGQLLQSEAAWFTEWSNCYYFRPDQLERPSKDKPCLREAPAHGDWVVGIFQVRSCFIVLLGCTLWPQDNVWRSCLQGWSLSRRHFHIIWGEEVMQRLAEPVHLAATEGEDDTHQGKLRRNLQWVQSPYSDHGVFLPESREPASSTMKGENRTWTCKGS